MRTFLILSAILLLLLLVAWETRAQERTPTKYGYTLDFAHVYVEVDTIHHTSQVFNYYHCKMWYSVNGGKATELKRAQVMTVWSNRFTLTVTRKKFKRVYKINQ